MSRDSYYLKRDRSLTKDVVPWDDDFAWDKLVNAGEFDAATAVKAFEHIENKNIEDSFDLMFDIDLDSADAQYQNVTDNYSGTLFSDLDVNTQPQLMHEKNVEDLFIETQQAIYNQIMDAYSTSDMLFDANVSFAKYDRGSEYPQLRTSGSGDQWDMTHPDWQLKDAKEHSDYDIKLSNAANIISKAIVLEGYKYKTTGDEIHKTNALNLLKSVKQAKGDWNVLADDFEWEGMEIYQDLSGGDQTRNTGRVKEDMTGQRVHGKHRLESVVSIIEGNENNLASGLELSGREIISLAEDLFPFESHISSQQEEAMIKAGNEDLIGLIDPPDAIDISLLEDNPNLSESIGSGEAVGVSMHKNTQALFDEWNAVFQISDPVLGEITDDWKKDIPFSRDRTTFHGAGYEGPSEYMNIDEYKAERLLYQKKVGEK